MSPSNSRESPESKAGRQSLSPPPGALNRLVNVIYPLPVNFLWAQKSVLVTRIPSGNCISGALQRGNLQGILRFRRGGYR